MIRMALISPVLVMGCTGNPGQPLTAAFAPDYRGIETQALAEDLVNVTVRMAGARNIEDLNAYAECAAAQYTVSNGYGFARHLRTNTQQEGSAWRADAVYTVSAALPPGLATIDAEVTVASCKETGIPTV